MSITQGLTQIHSVRRRTGSKMMRISQPQSPMGAILPGRFPDNVEKRPRAQSSQRLQPVLLQGRSLTEVQSQPAASSSSGQYPLVRCRLKWSNVSPDQKMTNAISQSEKSPCGSAHTSLHRYGYQGRREGAEEMEEDGTQKKK
ncbi:unnamed protein product [Pleuronectes platessa]|uniref:Uncharacterized protein n=1 Tax=Pleuronectes platessa TaxID=8262 RepID=A0A9N7VQX7_PLEPL|nr:unnamed protein product [Pleuronectes platessa]